MAFKLLCFTLSIVHYVYAQNILLSPDKVQKYVGARCRMDSGLGECVHAYLCNETTNTINDDGSSVFDVRVNESPIDCPTPLICCGSENNVENQGAKHTPPPVAAKNTLQEVRQYVGAPCRMDSGLGECVHVYLCNKSTNTINDDGSSVFDIRFSASPINCPLPLICCGSENNIANQGAKKTNVKPAFGSCGWRNPKGVNATRKVTANQAKLGEFPWLINVMRFVEQNALSFDLKYLGDGALIHNKVVLCAAHTVEDYDATMLRVVAGEYDMSEKPGLARVVTLVRAVKIHPKFTRRNLYNNFALLFLQSEVAFGPYIAPICLASPTTEMPVGTRCIAAGWGRDRRGIEQTLEAMVELPLVDHEVCQAHQRTTKAGLYFKLHESFICAGGEIGPDTCRGSGGAPLVCPIASQPGRYVSVGVESFDMVCGADGVPAVYSKVAYARTWIDQTIADEGLSTDVYSV